MKIAMVCLGNICRSPMAEVAATALLEGAGLRHVASVESFGTSGYHTGESIDSGAKDALARRGWNGSQHRARRLTPQDIERQDLVLCADRANLAAVMKLASSLTGAPRIVLLRSYDATAVAAGAFDVPDPFGGDAAEFDEVLEMIEDACRGLVRDISAGRES